MFLIVLSLFLFILCIYTINSKDYSYVLTQSRETVNDINWNNSVSIERSAYLLVYHQSKSITSYEKEQFLGIRILLKTLYLTNTKRDILIYVTTTVQQSYLDILSNDIPIEYQSQVKIIKKDRITSNGYCEHKFLPIYGWNEYNNYDRIIYLSHSNLIQLNLDELFLCSEYCSVFSSWLYFSDLLAVFKPKELVYNDLMNIFYQHIDSSLTTSTTQAQCDLKSQQFF